MIEGLQPYTEYKESGQKWLGAAPSHWNVHQARQIGRLLKGSGGSKADNVEEGIPCVRYGQLYTKYRGFIHAPKGFIRPSHISRYTAIQYGDVLFAASGEKVEEIGKSAVNLMRNAAVCGGDVIILRPRMEVFPPFLGYALDSYATASQKATMCRGSTIKHIYPDELRLLVALFPPPDEQAAIVRFLDHANQKIDGFIRAKWKLIALLGEQKQAIIHRAVTRGLNPKDPLKPSGIPWLGDIPKHWELIPNRAFLSVRKELVGDRSSEYTLLSLTLRGVVARDMENPTGKFPAEFNTYQEVQPGDLIFCLFDIDETPRGVGLSRLAGMITGAYTVFESRDPDIAEYLYLFYLAMDEEKCLKPLYTGLRKTIPKSRFLGTKTPVPPEPERAAIIKHVGERTAHLNTIIARTEREIVLMQEYRTRLTADVVTGKLDVRVAAAHLPVLPADSTPDTAADEALEEAEPDEIEP